MYKYLKNTLLNFDTINIDDVTNVTISKTENSLNVTPTLNIQFYDRNSKDQRHYKYYE